MKFYLEKQTRVWIWLMAIVCQCPMTLKMTPLDDGPALTKAKRELKFIS
jgi:hypothetical protein